MGPAAREQRILEVTAGPVEVNGNRILIGTTIGVAFVPRDALTHDHLIASADQALYEGKKTGRHCYCFAGSCPALQPSMQEAASSVAVAL